MITAQVATDREVAERPETGEGVAERLRGLNWTPSELISSSAEGRSFARYASDTHGPGAVSTHDAEASVGRRWTELLGRLRSKRPTDEAAEGLRGLNWTPAELLVPVAKEAMTGGADDLAGSLDVASWRSPAG